MQSLSLEMRFTMAHPRPSRMTAWEGHPTLKLISHIDGAGFDLRICATRGARCTTCVRCTSEMHNMHKCKRMWRVTNLCKLLHIFFACGKNLSNSWHILVALEFPPAGLVVSHKSICPHHLCELGEWVGGWFQVILIWGGWCHAVPLRTTLEAPSAWHVARNERSEKPSKGADIRWNCLSIEQSWVKRNCLPSKNWNASNVTTSLVSCSLWEVELRELWVEDMRELCSVRIRMNWVHKKWGMWKSQSGNRYRPQIYLSCRVEVHRVTERPCLHSLHLSGNSVLSWSETQTLLFSTYVAWVFQA